MNQSTKPLNQILAENLRFYMELAGVETQQALATRSGVAQKTISNYLHPIHRLRTQSGKDPSAKLTEVEKLAKSLRIEPWLLLRDMDPEAKRFYMSIETALESVRRH